MTIIKTRIEKLLNYLNKGLYEREEVIAVSLLAALSGQSVFYLGPPGTAKSLMARRLNCAFKDTKFFDYLMNRFSTPDEIFGPVSIKEMKNDKYCRKTTGYLPKADVGFLDEIWKSSPAILNALLTIINEKLFRNGRKVEKVPLNFLITASNETPPENQGLSALYDRCIARLYIAPLKDKNNFNLLLKGPTLKAETNIPDDIIITKQEWKSWRKKADKIFLSDETVFVINAIKMDIETYNKQPDTESVSISDRRWQKACLLIRMSALLCSRKITNLSDTFILKHCLWSTNKNRQDIIQITEHCIFEQGINAISDLSELNFQKELLQNKIDAELFHSNGQNEITKIIGSNYFPIAINLKKYPGAKSYLPKQFNPNRKFYILVGNIRTNKNFHPVDLNGKQIKYLLCNFYGRSACQLKIEWSRLKYNNHYQENWSDLELVQSKTMEPKSRRKQPTKKKINALSIMNSDIRSSLVDKMKYSQKAFKKQAKQFDSPFVPKEKSDLLISKLQEMISDIEVQITDCDQIQHILDQAYLGTQNRKTGSVAI